MEQRGLARAILSVGIAATVAGAALALSASAAWSQVKPGSETGLGLTGAEVPPLLQAIKAEPYKAPGAQACETVPAEIQQITDLVGPDVDFIPPETDATTDVKNTAMKSGASMVRGMVPYGSVLRYVTGANKKDAALREAIFAGYARRGFLRGVEMNLKCHSPAAASAAEPEKPAKAKRRR